MPQNTVTVQVVGSQEDEGHVTLSAFLSQLEAVKAALKQTERLVSGEDEPSVYYRVIDLRHASPATVVLQAVPVPLPPKLPRKTLRRPDYAEATVKQFFRSLRQIRDRKQPPPKADLQALLAYKNLAATLEKKVTEVKFANSEESVQIDRQFETAIDEIIGPDELIEGTACGTLERINLHNATQFDIFPTIGAKRIACEFPPRLKRQVIAAVDEYVCVTGKLRYKRLENFPYAVGAESIEVLPPESELPTLLELKGIAPELTRGKSTEDFLRELRDAEGW